MDYIFNPGDRVQLHPATDLWMRGARYGKVLRVWPATATARARVRVKLDALRRPVTLDAGDVNPSENRVEGRLT